MINNEQKSLKESNIDEILITEASKDIIQIIKNTRSIKNMTPYEFNKILESYQINKKDEKLRKINLIYLCLLQFHGLIRYMHFQELTQEDIRKMTYFIKHIFIKKGQYLFRQGDKSDALYGIIKGKVTIREVHTIDLTKKFKNEKEKDFEDDDFKETKENLIPFEVFMSDCEDISDEEDENNNNNNNGDNNNNDKKDKNDNSIANNELEKELLPMDEKKFEKFYQKNLKRLSNKTEEDIDKEIDFKIKKHLLKKIKLSIEFKEKISKKKKKTKNPPIKCKKYYQTPTEKIEGEILEKFINEFEIEKFDIINGMCFGEWGLVYTIPRTTSIYAKEDSHLFYLEKLYFDKILTHIFQRADLNKVNFLTKTLPIFKIGIKVGHILTKIIPFFFEKQTIVYTPFDIAENLYLVYQGECSSIYLPFAKEKKDYFEKIRDVKIISKFQNGAIIGFESCLKKENKYKTGLLITREYTTLMKVNIKYICQFFPKFKESIIEIYNEEIKAHQKLEENVKLVKENYSFYEKIKNKDIKIENYNSIIKDKIKIIPRNNLGIKILNLKTDSIIKTLKTQKKNSKYFNQSKEKVKSRFKIYKTNLNIFLSSLDINNLKTKTNKTFSSSENFFKQNQNITFSEDKNVTSMYHSGVLEGIINNKKNYNKNKKLKLMSKAKIEKKLKNLQNIETGMFSLPLLNEFHFN